MLPHANQSRPQVQCNSTLIVKETLNPIVSTRMYDAEESRSSFQCCNVFFQDYLTCLPKMAICCPQGRDALRQ